MTRKTPTYSTSTEVDSPLSGLASAPFATQDLGQVKNALDGISVSAENVAKSLSKTFASASASSQAFNVALSSVATTLSSVLAASIAGPLQSGFSSILSGFTGSLGGGGGGAATVAPFADGGVVASPTFFGAGGSVGLMGERGAEAILPLSRGPNGQLGIAAQQGGGRAVNVNVSIATNDAESFRRSEAQVTGALARAVARGQRST